MLLYYYRPIYAHIYVRASLSLLAFEKETGDDRKRMLSHGVSDNSILYFQFC